MGSASFLTPVYLFSSISAGTGKASLLANYAVFLNNAGNRIALIDLDFSTPLKLRNAFPESINLQIYEEISNNVQSQQSRYQKTFFFTDTEKISLFPINKIKTPDSLFTDAALRDFFIQARASFDYVFINFPSGDKYCLLASALLEQQHLWHGNPPASIFISRPDIKSLKLLDGISRKAPAFMFQTRENALIIFNRVPQSLNEQKISDNDLTSSEIKKLFNFSNLYFIPETEEFPHQRNIAAPIVLKTDSFLKQIFSGLNRFLSSGISKDIQQDQQAQSDFAPCLDGELLDGLSPYLYEIKKSAAVRLFAETDDIQIFLEESKDSYQIRVRLTGQKQQILGINRQIEEKFPVKLTEKPAPEIFNFCFDKKLLKKSRVRDKKFIPEVKSKPVYRFDDRFSNTTTFSPKTGIDFCLQRYNYPSPIYFKFLQQFKEIPTLSQVLGLDSKKYVKFSFVKKTNIYSIGGVTHFFIPPEFDIEIDNECKYKEQFFVELAKTFSLEMTHDRLAVIAHPFEDNQQETDFFIEDIFARDKKIEKTTNEIVEVVSFYSANFFNSHLESKSFEFNFSDFKQTPTINQPNFDLPELATSILPEILPLYEFKAAKEIDNEFKQDSIFEKSVPFFQPKKEFKIVDNMDFLQTDKSLKPLLINSNNFSFLFSLPDFSFNLNFITTLNKKAPDSPEYFTQTQENQIEKFFVKEFNERAFLDKKISLESKLLDYNFKFALTSLKGAYNVPCLNKSFNLSNLSLKTFITTELFFQPSRESIPDLFNQAVDKLNFLFSRPCQIFKNLSLELPRNLTKFSWEVLPIYVLPTCDNSYKELDKNDYFRTDLITDSNKTQIDSSILKSDILKIKKLPESIINRTAKSFYSVARLPEIEINNFKGYTKPLTDIKPKFSCTAPVLPETSKLQHEFTQEWNSRFTSHYDLENYSFAKARTPQWYVLPPVVYCLPFHCQIDMLCKPQAGNEFGKIISFCPSIYDELQQHDLGFNIYSYQISHCIPKIPKQIPHRNLVFEVKMPTGNEKEIIDNIKLPKKRIRKQKEHKYRDKSGKSKQKHILENSIPKIDNRYPLFKPLINWPTVSKANNLNLSISPPEPLEELYKHLLYSLNKRFKAKQDLLFHPLTIQPIDFELKHAPSILHFKDRVFFVRRILACKQKMGRNNDRTSFKIADLNYKDLLKLASKTSKKFKTLDHKNSS
jgi:MinD-like ATPase involved in chromosome partitioning or flagellar assembly